MKTYSATLLLLLGCVQGDVYIHTAISPGSNNRLDEANRERNNANRMFDSQNNNRGGYNVGKMQAYAGEKVKMAWTNQHGSSKYQMENTEFVLQYMCEPLLRDGTSTATIPEHRIQCQNFDCDTDVRYGRHESYDFYNRCKTTERNKGLFIANQQLKGQSARFTRQNPNGNRHAYECPEERDYYPYWRASPWKDIAYITNDVERCEKVTAESQNVKPRGYCTLPAAYYNTEHAQKNINLPGNKLYPIGKAACDEFEVTLKSQTNETTYGGIWKTVPAWGLEKPECVQTEQTRANHLGTVGGRTQYAYEFTVPDDIGDQSRCVTRVRYNITTQEYDAWESGASVNAGINSTYNKGKQGGNANQVPAQLDMWSKYGLSKLENMKENGQFVAGDSREYVFKNNPQVELLKPFVNGEYQSGADDKFTSANGEFRFKLQLAVNTAQFGRTFQDRTHAYSIRTRPDDIPAEAEIHQITVTGKRGNIVQTFPAHEYFFFPDTAHIPIGDYAHWTWTGSNTNPNNNDGQGKQGTDRSNVVALRVNRYDKDQYSNFNWDRQYSEDNAAPVKQKGETGDAGASYPAYVQKPEGYQIPTMIFGQSKVGNGAVTNADGKKVPLLMTHNLLEGALGGMSAEFLAQLATGRQATERDFGNMEELDDASTSVDMKPVKMTAKGCWNYLSTRNNNFSNRSQKGKLCVSEGSVSTSMIGENGGSTTTKYGDMLMITEGSVIGVQNVRFESWPEDSTNVIKIANLQMREDALFMGAVHYEPKSLHSPVVMHCPGDCEDGNWKKIDQETVTFELVDGKNRATLWANEGGLYKVSHEQNVAAIAAIAIGALVFCCALGTVVYFRMRNKRLESSVL